VPRGAAGDARPAPAASGPRERPCAATRRDHTRRRDACATILDVPTDSGELVEDEEDDPLVCAVCASGDASADNPIIKCDGEHSEEVGYHLACLNPPLEAVPLDEWFCSGCQDKGLYAVQAVKEKKTMARINPNTRQRTGKKCMHYLVEWAGAQWLGHDTWEPVDQLQGSHVKDLINAFNQKLRET
jgi:hypothetical protein